ncbi:hypothetical protein BBJ28_00003671 [Nothophytophthora sp. Chile5]|nr:hypothetical protein BBJ28_00003671 [Nothophytophthora sp. Chile5]
MPPSSRRRQRGTHHHGSGGVGFWLRRNAWLVAAGALVFAYCLFMLRTTMWARAFGSDRESQAHGNEAAKVSGEGQAMRDAMAVLKEMGALREERMEEQAEEQAEEAAAEGRGRLAEGDGEPEAVGEAEAHNDHAEATAGPRLRTGEEDDTVAYDDKVPLENVGEVPVVGAAADEEAQLPPGDTTTEEPEDHKWTAFDDLPLAGDTVDQGQQREDAAEASDVLIAAENKGPKPLTATVARPSDESSHVWTGIDDLPVAEDGTGPQAPIADGSAVTKAQTTAFTSRRFDRSRLLADSASPQRSNGSITFEQRHHTVVGYNAMLAYLQNYTKPLGSQEELFLFFTCSDAQGAEEDWKPICAEAREKAYAAFALSPSTNRLVTVYAGAEDDWKGGNAFTDDRDIRLKTIPTIMRWDGGVPGSIRATWGVLVEQSMLYEPLLRYLFRNSDEQDRLLANPAVPTKEIVTLRGYAQYRAYMDAYARNNAPFPLFMMMVSGRFQHNNRLWCPWCRQSEMPVEYAFYAYAPPKSKLIIVETYDKYKEWRNPENDFKKDPALAMKGVPWFYRVYPGPPGEPLTYQRVKQRFYILEALQWVFEGSL